MKARARLRAAHAAPHALTLDSHTPLQIDVACTKHPWLLLMLGSIAAFFVALCGACVCAKCKEAKTAVDTSDNPEPIGFMPVCGLRLANTHSLAHSLAALTRSLAHSPAHLLINFLTLTFALSLILTLTHPLSPTHSPNQSISFTHMHARTGKQAHTGTHARPDMYRRGHTGLVQAHTKMPACGTNTCMSIWMCVYGRMQLHTRTHILVHTRTHDCTIARTHAYTPMDAPIIHPQRLKYRARECTPRTHTPQSAAHAPVSLHIPSPSTK